MWKVIVTDPQTKETATANFGEDKSLAAMFFNHLWREYLMNGHHSVSHISRPNFFEIIPLKAREPVALIEMIHESDRLYEARVTKPNGEQYTQPLGSERTTALIQLDEVLASVAQHKRVVGRHPGADMKWIVVADDGAVTTVEMIEKPLMSKEGC